MRLELARESSCKRYRARAIVLEVTQDLPSGIVAWRTGDAAQGARTARAGPPFRSSRASPALALNHSCLAWQKTPSAPVKRRRALHVAANGSLQAAASVGLSDSNPGSIPPSR